MDKERFEDLCVVYALGTITKAELEELRDAVEQGGQDYAEMLAAYESTGQHFAFTTGTAVPKPGVKDAVFSRISRADIQAQTSEPDEEITPLKPSVTANTYLALAAALVLSLLAVFFYYNNTQLTQELSALEETVEQQRFELMDLRNQLAAAEDFLNIISSRNTQLVAMGGLDPSPAAFGRLFIDQETSRAVLQIAELPATPADKDYQLWVIRPGEDPVSAGVFSLETGLENYYLAIDNFVEEDTGLIAAVAITIEPKGGMPQPTGDMFLLGAP